MMGAEVRLSAARLLTALLLVVLAAPAWAGSKEDCAQLRSYRFAYGFCLAFQGDDDGCRNAGDETFQAQCLALARRSLTPCKGDDAAAKMCRAVAVGKSAGCKSSGGTEPQIRWCRALTERAEEHCTYTKDLKRDCTYVMKRLAELETERKTVVEDDDDGVATPLSPAPVDTPTTFSSVDVQSSVFKAMVAKHGADKLTQVMAELEAEVSDRVASTPEIRQPMRLLDDVMTRGHVFRGTPVITGFSSTGVPVIRWEDDVDGLESIGTAGFKAASKEVAREAAERASDGGRLVESGGELAEVLAWAKSQVPHGETQDGCDPRAIWLASALETVLGYKVSRIKVSHADGELFEQQAPFPTDASWRMHTAPMLHDTSGREWVIDVALPRVLERRAWEAALTHAAETKVSAQVGWDAPTDYGDGQAGPTEDIARTVEDLRGYYLYETVDGNDRDRRDGSEAWVKGERGFGPVGTVTPVVDVPIRVVMSLTDNEDGTWTPRIREFPASAAGGFTVHPGTGLYFRKAADLAHADHLAQ